MPQGFGWPHAILASSGSAGPHRVSWPPARAAYSHSASVGSLPPAQRQNSWASYQVTEPIGRSSLAQPGFLLYSSSGGMGRPVASAKRLYAAVVTLVFPTQNPWVIVTW